MNIIAQLQGGLGNQLFQYATARAMAHKHQCQVLLDYSWFIKIDQDVTPREPLLSSLDIQGIPISPESITKKPSRTQKILQELWPISTYIYTEKSHYKFDPYLGMAPAFKSQNLHLMGYWQSFRYFDSIKKILQTEITPKISLDSHYRDYLNQIKSTNSAMLHVRRGDYVNLASAAKIHGFIGLKYYQRGIEILLKKYGDIQFFVFSDDLAWAEENLPHKDKITLIRSLEGKDAVIQELELMTHCQHHLIANSSLSWWGAWLAKSESGSIICPKKWTNDCQMNGDDLLPFHWQKI